MAQSPLVSSEVVDLSPTSIPLIDPPLTSRRWQYAGEGGANIVVSLPDQTLALRFPKTPSTTGSSACGGSEEDGDEAREVERKLVRAVEFGRDVMSALLPGWCVMGSCQLVRLSSDDQHQLDKQLELMRPHWRQSSSSSQLNAAGLALLMPDCTQLPTANTVADQLKLLQVSAEKQSRQNSWRRRRTSCQPLSVLSVEIKVKQGFKDIGDPVTGDSTAHSLCTFCRKQFLKRRDYQMRRSRYCPLDLFSGCRRRFTRAVNALIARPQNNWRVFVDGISCYGDSGSQQCDGEAEAQLMEQLSTVVGVQTDEDKCELFQLLADLLYTVLHSETTVENKGLRERSMGSAELRGPSGESEDLREGFGLSSESVPSAQREEHDDMCAHSVCVQGRGPRANSLLGRLLAVQQMCAPSPSSASAALHRLMSSESAGARLRHVFEAPFSEPCWHRLIDGSEPPRESVDRDIWQVQRYCVGASIRDCSVLVCLQRVVGAAEEGSRRAEEGGCVSHVTDSYGQNWRYVCRVIDTDLKPINCADTQFNKQKMAVQMCDQQP